MRTSTAFFAGIGTVIVAIGAGLGGGLLLGDIMSPQQPKHPSSEVTRLEQRGSQAPITATNSAPQPVPYVASSQVAAAVAEPAPQQKQTEAPPQPQPQQPPQQTAAKPAEEAKPAPAVVQPAMAADQPAARERAAPEDSLTKARDTDIKRETRRADDRRKAERRQQWAEKRKWRQRDGDDLRDVEASVRQATEPRPFFGEPRFGSRIGLFEQD
jgi:type IV secretory pathway VirB10-like protein